MQIDDEMGFLWIDPCVYNEPEVRRMHKGIRCVCAVLVSVVLCALALFLPIGDGSLWQQSCINVYSIFGATFFVMNTVGCIGMACGYTFGEKPYTKERPAIEKKKHDMAAAVLAFFEVPLLLTMFFIDGGWKMVACTSLLLLSWILGALIGDASANKLRKEFCDTEQRELTEQLRKEEAL